jgi:hypothetical protein
MSLNRFAKPLAVVIVASLVLFLFGFRLVHPQDGLSNALGSAQSSIAVVKKANLYKSGDKIVAEAQVGKSPVLGVIASAENGSLELILDNSVARTTPEKVSGKLVAVIPFVGYLFSAVGL